MIRKVTSLEEDFKQLGIKKPNLLEQVEADLGMNPGGEPEGDELDEGEKVADAYKCEACGEVVHKPKDDEKKEDAYSQQYPPKECPECGKAGLKPYVVPSGKKEDVDEDDPLESPTVNHEMFKAIKELPFAELTVEQIDEVIEELAGRDLPDDASEELQEEAQEVVEMLFDKRAEIGEGRYADTRRSRRRSVGKAKKGKSKVRAGAGFHMKDGKPVRQKKADLLKKQRENKRIAKGKGKTYKRKSAIRQARYNSLEINAPMLGEDASPFARELHSLVEEKVEQDITVRHEIMERIQNIFEMLNEEFRDSDVASIFEDTLSGVVAAWEAGRLDEDVMDEDEFIGEIKPVLALIQKSLDRIDRAERGELGN